MSGPASAHVHVCVATPCFAGQVTQAYHVSMMALTEACREARIPLSAIYTGGDSLITRARNTLVNQMLADPVFTHLFFIDADIGFEPDQALRLIRSGFDVVGGVYPVKSVFWDRIADEPGLSATDREARSLEYVVGLGPPPHESRDGFVKAERLGTGFMLISRRALRVVAACFPEARYTTHDSAERTIAKPDAQRHVALFDTMIDPASGRYYSEDYAFCERCRAAGIDVWADMTSRLRHIGFSSFSGDVAAKVRRLA